MEDDRESSGKAAGQREGPGGKGREKGKDGDEEMGRSRNEDKDKGVLNIRKSRLPSHTASPKGRSLSNVLAHSDPCFPPL